MLADVQDRLGSVCLLEVIMLERVDVAEFLLTKHRASIEIEDLDGCSPRKMSLGPAQMANCVAKMVANAAFSDGKKNQKVRKEIHASTCTYCGVHNESREELPSCAKCSSVYYCDGDCQRAHWDAGHKQECRILRHGIKLDPPMMFSASISFTTMTTSAGSYRRPDVVSENKKFVVKVQAISEACPIAIYDKTRQCSFDVSPGQPGFSELLAAARAEPTWMGRKCFMKASFDGMGVCKVFPGTSKLKKDYDW